MEIIGANQSKVKSENTQEHPDREGLCKNGRSKQLPNAAIPAQHHFLKLLYLAAVVSFPVRLVNSLNFKRLQ
jgi:hypothetical protein